jgi:hypothetical protein
MLRLFALSRALSIALRQSCRNAITASAFEAR